VQQSELLLFICNVQQSELLLLFNATKYTFKPPHNQSVCQIKATANGPSDTPFDLQAFWGSLINIGLFANISDEWSSCGFSEVSVGASFVVD
jgi:hypothetical protein